MNDNINEITEDEKRIIRRKKRKRNRIIAWIFLLIFVLIICALIAFIAIKALPSIKLSWPSFMDKPGSEISAETDTDIDTDNGDILGAIDNIIGGEDDVIVHEPTPEELMPSEEKLFDEAVRRYVENMPLEDKVAGLFIIYPEQITGVKTVVQAGDGTKKALSENAVGGIVYRSQNITSLEQFKSMIDNTKSFARRPLFIGVNEELGNTVVASKLDLYKSDSQSVIGATGVADNAYSEAGQVADYLVSLGIDLNLGIVADVGQGPVSDVMEGRTFSADSSIVSQMVAATVKAYEEKGINTALSYFPGQSFANQDTAKGIASSDRTKMELEYNEFMVYEKGVAAGADMILVSHVVMPALTGEIESIQCSLSKAVMTDIIRDELGYKDIVIITDAMDKPSIAEYYEPGECAIKAIKAGADMIMCPADYEQAYKAVYDAVTSKVISELRITDALTRIYKVKFNGLSSQQIDEMSGN